MKRSFTMNRVMKHTYAFLVGGMFALFAMVNIASAATLQLSTEKDTFAIGDQFTVDVKVDSEGAGINAAQGTVQIAKDVLEIVSVDKAGSVFNFWLTEPTFSNESGQINFIGGSTSGFSGKSLQIVKVTFRVKGSGRADIVFSDGAVTASDGSGTNVLSSMKGLSITSVPKTELETIAPKPTQITRQAVAAEQLPARPDVQVAGYRDADAWHNFSNRFSVAWQLPADITDVATAINKDPSFIPTRSEGLFDNKLFAAPGEGISYLHVRFKNNVGWGPTLHHRIAVDTTPPPAFQAKIQEGEATDVPTPTIDFSASDGLSGVKRYFLQQNGGSQKTIDQGPYTMEPQKPGKYIVRIGVEDNAGNIVENALNLEIRPIEAPIIATIEHDVYVGEGSIDVLGTALPDATVEVYLKAKEGQVEQSVETKADEHGSWAARFDKPLKKGIYVIEVVARDARGAMSYPVLSEEINVRPRPALVIGALEVTQFWFFTFVILLLLGGVGAAWAIIRMREQQQGRKVMIAQRDIINAIANIEKDVEKILEKYSDDKIDESEVSEIQHLAKKVNENLKKARKYIVEDVGEINK